MKKIYFIAQIILAFSGVWCYGQQAGASKDILNRANAFFQNNPTEKAYLQFDKPYYAAGDTIYFKAYVTAGGQHKLSGISGVLHVDLINTNDKIDQSIKLQLDSGLTWGDFALPDSLPGGNYRIRAYTQWMRNDGENGFFEKVIPIGSVKPAKVSESIAKKPAAIGKPDIQFLPEGGNLIAGLPARVAFKAISPNGLGMDAKGVVTDNENREIVSFASVHLGMGEFTFTPAAGKTYSAKISYVNGVQDVIALPKVEPEGITLSLNNDSLPEAAVTIAANGVYYNHNKGKTYTLLIYSGGLITTVDCKLESPVIKLDILKRKLRTGVATVTLFSSENEPLCERLFFVQNYDALNLNIGTDKSNYGPRDKVSVKVTALNRKGEPSLGHFSVAVVNESLVPETNANSDNILTDVLLTSDLKGYVEQPGYYFGDTSSVALKNLDLLMLTQGYRRFEWKKMLDTATTAPAYQPEQTLTIAGRVDNVSNKPIANSTVTLIHPDGGGLLTALTDAKGLFHFTNLLFADTAHFVLSAVNGKGKNNTKITWFDDLKNSPGVGTIARPDFHVVSDTVLSAYAGNDKKELRELEKSFNRKTVILKQVNVHAKKPDNQYRTQSLAGAGNADQVVHSDVLDQVGGTLSTKLMGRFHGIIGSKISQGVMPGLIVVDGVEEPPGYSIDLIPGNLVETVELLQYGSTALYGMQGGYGVLIITTKQTMQLDPKDIPAIGVLPITIMGFYKARQFYSPKYDNPALSTKQRDLRSTICWQPEIKTDKQGNVSFDYYNADGTGTYRVIIEGIDNEGNIGRQVYRYEVK